METQKLLFKLSPISYQIIKSTLSYEPTFQISPPQQKDADLHRKDEALTAKEEECTKKDEELRRLQDKQKSLEASITDLEVSLASASEKAASLDRAKKKADAEIKRKCFTVFTSTSKLHFLISIVHPTFHIYCHVIINLAA